MQKNGLFLRDLKGVPFWILTILETFKFCFMSQKTSSNYCVILLKKALLRAKRASHSRVVGWSWQDRSLSRKCALQPCLCTLRSFKWALRQSNFALQRSICTPRSCICSLRLSIWVLCSSIRAPPVYLRAASKYFPFKQYVYKLICGSKL